MSFVVEDYTGWYTRDSSLRIGQQLAAVVTATGMDNPSTHGSRRKSDDLPLRSVGPVDDLQVCQRAMPNVTATRPFTSPERTVCLVNRQCLPLPEKLPARKRESTFEGDEVFTTARQSTRSCPPSSRSRSQGSFRSAVNVGSSHCGSGVPGVGPADQANDDLPTATRELISIRACSHRSRSCSHASLRNAANMRSSADGSPVRASPADHDMKLRRNSVKKVAAALPSADRERKVSNIPRPSKTSLSPAANHQAGSSCTQGGGRYSQANPQREAIVQRSPSHRNPEVGTDPEKPVVTRVAARPSAAGPERVVDKGKSVNRYSSPPPHPPPEEHHVDKQAVMRFAGRPSGASPERIVYKGHQRLASCPSSAAAPQTIVDKGKVMGSFKTPPPPKRRYVDNQVVMHSVGSHRPSATAGGPAEKILDKRKVKRYLHPSETQPYVDKEEEEEEEAKGLDVIDNSELPTRARDCCVENKISTVARELVLNTPTIPPSSKSGGPASNVIPDQPSCTRNPAGYLSTITKSTLSTIPPKKRWGLLQAFNSTTTTTGQSDL